MMTAQQRTAIETAAQAAAQCFVAEFGKALDPAEGDWDGVAWDDDKLAIGLPESEWGEGWEIYDAALVAETERLVAAAAL